MLISGLLIPFLLCLLIPLVKSNRRSAGIFKMASSSSKGECRSEQRPGDCHPDHCGQLGNACEARFVRFWDQHRQVDRTLRSCRCLQESICSLLNGPGCWNYGSLEKEAQRIVRKWTASSGAERRKMRARMGGKNGRRIWKNQNQDENSSGHYSDTERHNALLVGNSRFCCRIAGNSRNSAEQNTDLASCCWHCYCSLWLPIMIRLLPSIVIVLLFPFQPLFT